MVTNAHRNIHRSRTFQRCVFNDVFYLNHNNCHVVINKLLEKNQLPLISFKQYLLNICDYLRGVGNISIRKSVINIPKLIVSKEKKTCFVCRYISDEIYKCKRVTKYCNCHFQYLHEKCNLIFHNPTQ
ncbi:hypothetical protein ACTFIZ_008613 [Dictyostelium cf. discoideum]